jgi:plasmid stability protein
MTVQSITLNLPSAVYQKLQRRAQAAQRSIEAELLDVVVTAVPALDNIPADLNESVAQLQLLDDVALQRVARSTLPTETAQQLETLHLKQQREGLTPAERATAEALLNQYERHMLMRAEAVVLLKQRGHIVSSPEVV